MNELEVKSPKQAQLLSFITDYIKRHGIPPLHSEMCESVGAKGANLVSMLDKLERKGFIKRETQVPRSIRVLKSA